MIKPEIMSPAGYWPQLQAAIEAGADAVYFGLKHFTARAKVGFSLTELPSVMQTLHKRGVKGYVTFNTLVFDHELKEAAKTLAAIAEAGADAIIVQDIGVAKLAHKIAPTLDLHGSTQMSITSADGVKLAQQLGITRVVLARELSLSDLKLIRAQTDCELEMFVHGALCVSYSGQCFSSEAWGGRSANRGQCAQACRLSYEMLVDGKLKPLGDARYLLSPGDLYAIHQIPEIVEIGISALKIEGRYKDADYVALTTKAYRQAVDQAYSGRPIKISQEEELQLEQVYSRGLGAYFVTGTNHQEVVKGRSPRHRGLLMGRVIKVLADSVIISPEKSSLKAPLKPGDGLVFDAADWRSPDEKEEGGHLYEIRKIKPGQLELRFGKNDIEFNRIRPGDLVWRSHDSEIDKLVRPILQATTPLHKQPLKALVKAYEGLPLVIEFSLVSRPNIKVIVESNQPLTSAQNRALTIDLVREQLNRLGNTSYQLVELQLDKQGSPFVPSSLLNELRRQAVDQLVTKQSTLAEVTTNNPIKTLATLESETIQKTKSTATAQLHLLVRTSEQLEAALEFKPASITLDYLELYGLQPAVERVKASGINVRVASPRILKPDESRITDFLLKLDCELLIRSNGLLYSLQNTKHQSLIGDFSLNAANLLSADIFLSLGLTRFTPTHDLNAEQISKLAKKIGADKLETVVYQHLPVFHTEHCVFCRFLSTGTSYKDCGKPCEKHLVALRDKEGRSHPVMADVGCRNTVFGAEAQEASSFLDDWLEAGISHFRLEFVHQSAEQVTKIAQAFQNKLLGKISSEQLAKQLEKITTQGTTQGSLFVPKNYRSLPVLM